MIHIEHLTFNHFQTRCYIVWDNNGNCAFVDPGCLFPEEIKQLSEMVESNKLTPCCILLTHCHFDHIYGMSTLAKNYGIPVYAHNKELLTIEQANPGICNIYGLPLPDTFPIISDTSEGSAVCRHIKISAGNSIEVGELKFEVIETPGHTSGGVCFLERNEKVLFSGDTLFAGAIGRTDHLGGDYDMLMKSIFEKLMTLDGDITVHPGHGPSSDIATERMTNPFLMPFNEPID